MHVGLWTLLYVVQAAFWLWLIRFRGANAVEGSWAAWLLHPVAWRWNADLIRFYAWLSLITSTGWFVLGLLEPAARFWP
jgi:hypothetical protein